MKRKRVLRENGQSIVATKSVEGAGRAAVPPDTHPPEKLTVYLPRAAAKRLKQMALDHDKRVNDFLQEASS